MLDVIHTSMQYIHTHLCNRWFRHRYPDNLMETLFNTYTVRNKVMYVCNTYVLYICMLDLLTTALMTKIWDLRSNSKWEMRSPSNFLHTDCSASIREPPKWGPTYIHAYIYYACVLRISYIYIRKHTPICTNIQYILYMSLYTFIHTCNMYTYLIMYVCTNRALSYLGC